MKEFLAREAIDAFIGMVRFQVGSSARFNDLQHTSPSTMKITSNTIEMMAWQTKTASAFRIKKNPVALIAPKLSLSGVDWWTEWSKTLTLLSSLERFPDMDYLIPTLSKDFQGVIPRPSTSDRGLRWLKEALVRQGVDQALVTPLTWHSFRVFIPDCAYQLGIPRAQRQYLGNWQTESTADIYTREKRNVVVDIWSKILGKIQEVDLQPGRTVREDLAHPDLGMTSHWTSQGTRLWVGHKGSPLHTALVERRKFLVLGGLPQQTVFWNQNLTHRNQQVKGGWLLLVCHLLDALQTFENLLCLHLQGLCVQTFTAKMALPFWLKSFCSRKWENLNPPTLTKDGGTARSLSDTTIGNPRCTPGWNR